MKKVPVSVKGKKKITKKDKKVHKTVKKTKKSSLDLESELMNINEFISLASHRLAYVIEGIDFILKKLGYNDGSIAPSEWIDTDEIDYNVRKLKGIKE